ncbi:MAG: FtsQ-type POTRA domain-containing protein [Clostridiaceae bacterium]|nr:FtsQ-type POTRA domain-containing protein [Clostridiaceae bacterium]
MVLNNRSSGNLITTTETKLARRQKKRTSRKVFVLSLLFVGVLLSSLFLPVFNITSIVVVGNEKIASKSIIDLSQIEKGINIFRANLRKAKENIYEIPYIDYVKISRSYPNKIIINVKERKSVGYIPFMGSYIFIDQKGNVLEVVSEIEEGSLPVIKGLRFNEFALGEVIRVDDEKKLEAVVSCIRELVNVGLLDKVWGIDVSDLGNIQLRIEDRIDVNIGDSLKINYKMSFLKEILKELKPDERGYIDLTNVERATFQPEKQTGGEG